MIVLILCFLVSAHLAAIYPIVALSKKLTNKPVDKLIYEMEFPITRERLQNYREGQFISVERNQRIAKELKTICKEVEGIIINTYERKYKYSLPGDVIRPNLRMRTGQTRLPQPTSILQDLLQAVKDTFPDSNVILDPLDTYILIDWS